MFKLHKLRIKNIFKLLIFATLMSYANVSYPDDTSAEVEIEVETETTPTEHDDLTEAFELAMAEYDYMHENEE